MLKTSSSIERVRDIASKEVHVIVGHVEGLDFSDRGQNRATHFFFFNDLSKEKGNQITLVTLH